MIVGLLGFIGSGKGTAGEILSGLGFEPLSFAGGVKDVTAEMFDWPRELLEGNTEESRKWREVPDVFWSKRFGREFTPREALQLMGTEVGRGIFHENFWVDRLENKIQKDKNYVITDCRFFNEIDFIQRMGGTTIEIKRGITPHWYDIARKANTGDIKAINFMHNQSGVHSSEWSWIGGNIDHKIENEKSLEDLKENLIKCLKITYGSCIISELK